MLDKSFTGTQYTDYQSLRRLICVILWCEHADIAQVIKMSTVYPVRLLQREQLLKSSFNFFGCRWETAGNQSCRETLWRQQRVGAWKFVLLMLSADVLSLLFTICTNIWVNCVMWIAEIVDQITSCWLIMLCLVLSQVCIYTCAICVHVTFMQCMLLLNIYNHFKPLFCLFVSPEFSFNVGKKSCFLFVVSAGTDGNWNSGTSAEGARSLSNEIEKLSCWIVQTGKRSRMSLVKPLLFFVKMIMFLKMCL